MSVANSIHHSNSIYNYFKTLKLGLFLSDVYLNHLMTIIVSVFLRGYRGKTVDFAEVSNQHRTTTAYFLNHGKWNDSALQDTLKNAVIQVIYQEAHRSGHPVFCIVDDTIASNTRPSSQAGHPIEAAYFHQSHLKGCQDYGHQIVSVMLSCNGLILNYANILYDKSRSKIQSVREIADELPVENLLAVGGFDFKNDCVLLVKSDYHHCFYTVGGGIQENETPESAVIRECYEETSYHFEIDRLVFIEFE